MKIGDRDASSYPACPPLVVLTLFWAGTISFQSHAVDDYVETVGIVTLAKQGWIYKKFGKWWLQTGAINKWLIAQPWCTTEGEEPQESFVCGPGVELPDIVEQWEMVCARQH